ncbi:hypothetical protein K431DRAFT_64883 [Polychaeton citri CBS 116435]|uniref:Uncharacterized protein n=1 Tax=Polychaeton citri CBS 116435 TaxID=1314669 RepID=A0A9P4UQI4_9PEZI|nr:hypothetical protein K431DRAFT_64883 [Polychaeton citri CBS 116435]
MAASAMTCAIGNCCCCCRAGSLRAGMQVPALPSNFSFRYTVLLSRSATVLLISSSWLCSAMCRSVRRIGTVLFRWSERSNHGHRRASRPIVVL